MKVKFNIVKWVFFWMIAMFVFSLVKNLRKTATSQDYTNAQTQESEEH